MKFSIKPYRGDTLSLDIVAKYPPTAPVPLAGTPFDLTGSTLFFTLKRKITDTDANALIARQTGTGITHTDAAAGKANLRVEAVDLTSMPVLNPLPGDVQVKTPAGEIFTIAEGTITFLPDATIRTT